MDPIRLACRLCDGEDCDGVASVPHGWFDVQEVQSYAASLQTVDRNDSRKSVFDWFTHLGICPDCYEEAIRPELVA